MLIHAPRHHLMQQPRPGRVAWHQRITGAVALNNIWVYTASGWQHLTESVFTASGWQTLLKQWVYTATGWQKILGA